MNRRTFLTGLGAALTGAVLDPERLLWVPGRKTIFLPPIVVTPRNPLFFDTPDWVAKEALRNLKNNLIYLQLMYRDYDKEWT